MSAHMYMANYVPVEDPPEEEHPLLSLLSSGKWVGGEWRYTRDDVLSAVDEYMAVQEAKYRALMEIAIEAGARVGYQGGMPVRLDDWGRPK